MNKITISPKSPRVSSWTRLPWVPTCLCPCNFCTKSHFPLAFLISILFPIPCFSSSFYLTSVLYFCTSVSILPLPQKLQIDPKLTLEKAMKTIQQSTAVKEQQGQLNQLKEGSKGNLITIEEVMTGQPQMGEGGPSWGRDKSLRYHKGGARGTQPKIQGGAKSGQRKPQCKRCGKDHFPGERCPAKAATC